MLLRRGDKRQVEANMTKDRMDKMNVKQAAVRREAIEAITKGLLDGKEHDKPYDKAVAIKIALGLAGLKIVRIPKS